MLLQEAKGRRPCPAWLMMKKAELTALPTRVAGTGSLPEMLRVADATPEEPEGEAANIDADAV